MRRFIYATSILCVIFFVSGCKNKINPKTNLELNLGLNRPVKSIQVKTYWAEDKFGEIFKGELYDEENYLALFDAKGNLISITDFDEDGDVDSKTICKYDINNRITKLTVYDEDGDVSSSSEYWYQGEYIIKEKFIGYDGDIMLSEYKRNGVEIQESTSTLNGELTSKRIFLESNKERHLYVEYDETGKEIRTVLREFNKKGKILKETISCGKEDEITSYSYNKAGYITEKLTSSGKSGVVRYNEKNLPIYVNGCSFSHNTIVLMQYLYDESIYYFEYEYDNKGNWIKQIVYEGENKEPYTISERVINY